MGAPRQSSARSGPGRSDRDGLPARDGDRRQGKIEALRALETGDDFVPERDAHPLLHRAYRHARSLRATWAERYNLARTDPRYLDATDDDVVFDLLVLQYRSGERRRADPLQGQLDEVLRDPEGTRIAEEAFDRELEAGTLGERIRAFERNRQEREDPRIRLVQVQAPDRGKVRRLRRRVIPT